VTEQNGCNRLRNSRPKYEKLTKKAVFWDVTPCALVRTHVSEELNDPIISVTRISELEITSAVLRFLVTANVAHNSPILVTLMMEAIRSSETPVFTRATWRNIPEDNIPHSHCRENLKFYIELTGWAM
jgi:hypothetical protein